MVYGNTSGIKNIALDELESLLGMYDKNIFLEEEVLEVICRITDKVNREVSVFMSRGGELLAVGIGDSTSVPLADISIKRDMKRFNAIRCFHTHPNGYSTLSDADKSALLNGRYDCMAAIGVRNGKPTNMSCGYIIGKEIEEVVVNANSYDHDILIKKIRECEQFSLREGMHIFDGTRALLINVSADSNADLSLAELEKLATTADIEVIDRIHQRRNTPDREFYIGSGKLKEVAMICQVKNINKIIFDNALTPAQTSRVGNALGGIFVMDRSTLILDIFARHAITNEGKLQVELARLKYNLPRLLGKGHSMSRQGGGMQSRGGGEQQLEKDRRVIRAEIRKLTDKIAKLENQRNLRRKSREKSDIKTVAFVGYTNSGKSSLMNRLTSANVAVEDKLFKTLDSVTRTVHTADNNKYLLSDTVGFISRLPHEFIDAFKSTLEEVKLADLLLNVVDSSSEDMLQQYDIVLEVLSDLGAHAPIITVYNKSDIAGDFVPPMLKDSVQTSAVTGEGLKELKSIIELLLFKENKEK